MGIRKSVGKQKKSKRSAAASAVNREGIMRGAARASSRRTASGGPKSRRASA
jgi:hypothetical protein